jgi:hypothetical protein
LKNVESLKPKNCNCDCLPGTPTTSAGTVQEAAVGYDYIGSK